MFRLKQKLILGSRSPRRKQIFDMLGLEFTCKAPQYSEDMSCDHQKTEIVELPEFFAIQKSLSLSANNKSALVISYDTIVLIENRALGKPESPEDALRMLQLLNGKRHQVITGVALTTDNRIISSGKETTEVTFSRVKPWILKEYASSKEPADKAGSYAIQGRGALLVKKICGCYYNVMGAPIQLTLNMLEPYFYNITK
ncbi:Maf family protein [Fibrobacterota bacterium]